MKTTTKLWEDLYGKLGQVSLEQPSKNKVVKGTMTGSRGYRKRATRIVEELSIQYSILEIGCGYGGLAQEIMKKVPVLYTVVDNKAMLTQAKKFLGDRVEYIEAEKINSLRGRRFGLFISHYCLSETPAGYRRYVLKNIIPNCQRISIRDLDDGFQLTRRMVRDGYEVASVDTEEWLRKYFTIEKTRTGKNQSVYTGERLE